MRRTVREEAGRGVEHGELAPALAGLIAREALGRVDAIAASLGSSADPAPADVRWACEAAGCLAGLTAQLGDPELARAGEGAQAKIEALQATTISSPGALSGVLAGLAGMRPALEHHAEAADGEPVALDVIARLAAAEVKRIARRRGVKVAIDLICPEGIAVPAREAGVVIDVLGQVVRDGTTHGTREGGAVRMVFAVDDHGLVILASDRGDAGSGQFPASERSPSRGAGLGVAHGRLVALGGELSFASGAWGGTSVTIRLPTEVSRSPAPDAESEESVSQLG